MVKILVIDDDDSMRRTINRILVGAGHDVIVAKDGYEGTKLFRTDHPDIVMVVTDIFMPRKEGLETILELRQEHPSTLILAISGGANRPGGAAGPDGSAPADYLDMGKAMGADGILAKPFRADELLREVDKLLQGRQAGE